MTKREEDAVQVDPTGFNNLKYCRFGPMLYNKNDRYVGRSLETYGEFSLGELQLFQQLIQMDQVVVEAGSNVGSHTVELSWLAGPGGQVHAFEPQRIIFQTLCANLALNHRTNVFAHHAALGDHVGTILTPVVTPSEHHNFGEESLPTVESGEPVPVVTLDSLNLQACHFLKADVQRMEVELLTGASETIRKFRPILYLENEYEDRSRELLELVMSMDYVPYWHLPPLYHPDNFRGETKNLWPGIVSINILCLPSESPLIVRDMRRVVSPSESWRRQDSV